MPKTSSTNPLLGIIESQGFVVLDGGLATALESSGHDLNDELWSAKVLLEAPEAIRRVHLDFLRAGADCIATSSYQASLAGLRKRGLNEDEATRLLRLSVELALEARRSFWDEPANRRGRVRPLVAASVGPYGAFLADGSEYTGHYAVGERELRDFHESRWRILADGRADLLACETIPSRREAVVLIDLLRESADMWAWLSFSCADGKHLSDGSRLEDVARDCEGEARIAAVGINCTSPVFIASLIREVRKGTTKPIIVYPNRGERWDPKNKAWSAASEVVDWRRAAAKWVQLGAIGVGGCCRVGPEDIVEVRKGLAARAPDVCSP
jgi:homocysteine S-methyltransferase